MSRVGKKPIPIPDKAKIAYSGKTITVEGEKGKLQREIHPLVDLAIEDKEIKVEMKQPNRESHAIQGLTRTLIANMITGVTDGYERKLEINGIGYRAEVSGKSIILNIGYSQPVEYPVPEGVTASVDKNNVIKLSGIDKELLGHSAATIRRLRPPEPYKGKGIKFAGERIQRKAGKAGAK
jgi:large subunit ribosomal protein L6